MAYNPSIHTATNKPIGLTNKPVDARTYYYDSASFSYRPYTSTSEVLAYLVNPSDRIGHFSIIVGTSEYWFRDGVADGDLVIKESLPSGGLTGQALVKASGTDYDTVWFDFDTLYVKLAGSYEDPSWISSLSWDKIIDTPTTIAGYGITDFNSLGDARWLQQTGGVLIGDVQQTAIPVNGSSLITKSYADNLVTGLSWKQEVRAGTTANITLSGTQTIDGVALVNGDRVLVKNQTNAIENGIYAVGTPWTRTSDANTPSEIGSSTVLVRNGTTNKNTQWTCTNSVDPVIGTDNITYGQISGAGTYVNGTGISLTANVFSLNTTFTDARYLTLAGTNQTITQSPVFAPSSGTTGLTVQGAGIDHAEIHFADVGGTAYINGGGGGLRFSSTYDGSGLSRFQFYANAIGTNPTLMINSHSSFGATYSFYDGLGGVNAPFVIDASAKAIKFQAAIGSNQTLLKFTTPTAGRTIIFPDATGNVALDVTPYYSLGAYGSGHATKIGNNNSYLYTPFTDGTQDGFVGWGYAIGNRTIQLYFKPSDSNTRFGVYGFTSGVADLTEKLAYLSDITSSISGSANAIPKFSGTNSLTNSAISDNGTDVVAIMSRKLGIGTSSPSALLELKSSALTNLGGFLLRSNTNSNIVSNIYEGSAGQGTFDLYNGSNSVSVKLIGNGSSYFNGGKLGIGTSGPNAQLESLSTTEQLRLSYDATHYAAFTVTSAGNLGVSPIGGTISFTGDIGATRGFFNSVNNATSSNNASIVLATTGTTISRSIADANTALIINQANASSTGNIVEWQAAGVTKASINKNGSGSFLDVIGTGKALFSANYGTTGISGLAGANSFGKTLLVNNISNGSGETNIINVQGTDAFAVGGFALQRLSTAGAVNTYLEINGGTGAGTFHGAWLPSDDASYDLGSASLRWNNMYVNNLSLSTVNIDAVQTFVPGSTSGQIVGWMPFQGGTYKVAFIRVEALDGTATYNYPVAFNNIYFVDQAGGGGLAVNTASNTSVTLTASSGATSGFVKIIGY